MSAVVAGGEVVLVFVMVKTPVLPVTAVAGTPSMNQMISVSGRLKSVMVTVKVRVEPATNSMSALSARKVGPTVQKEVVTTVITNNNTELTSLNDNNGRRVHSKTTSCITSVHPIVISTCY